MSSEVLLTRREGAVLVLVNNNPSAKNAISPEYFEAVTSALATAQLDPSIGAIVLTGSGGYFCAGGNLRQIKETREKPTEERLKRLGALNSFVRTICECKKPIIAAVEGGAAGAGMSIALACDLVVASREALFAAAYVKVGLTPDGGLTSFLAQLMPRHLLAEICMTGTPVSALQLHQLGAINRIVDVGRAEAEAIELGRRIAQGPARALGRIKQLSHSTFDTSLNEQLELEAAAMAESQGDDESAEGIRAFLEKRPANFVSVRQNPTDKPVTSDE